MNNESPRNQNVEARMWQPQKKKGKKRMFGTIATFTIVIVGDFDRHRGEISLLLSGKTVTIQDRLQVRFDHPDSVGTTALLYFTTLSVCLCLSVNNSFLTLEFTISTLSMTTHEKYSRILSIMSLSEVENPWKGISLNRCIVLAIAIVVLISGVEMVQDSVKPIFEVAEDTDGMNPFEAAWWDNLAFWNWGESEFSPDQEARQAGEKTGPKGLRKRENPNKLLKDKN
ncbi:hypothetical protein C0J50_19711 [Silurus asotus]|uniref:Uncharacterized protein n=1 Tax=Silurus asotus TaxID=30991 RepID=A0AAD5AS06_SILAS|nr:hypothetical protein C0J50_19711 [Silurus asotus]